jgi:hypothetical protein
MEFERAIFWLKDGRRLRRSNWAPDVNIIQEEWQGIQVATLIQPSRLNEFYNFPLADVLATDWEIYFR